MKLSDLNPKWELGEKGERHHLSFECPAQHHHRAPEDIDDQRTGMRCQIVLPVWPEWSQSWKVAGEDFETLTVTPSIWHHCEKDPHFFITNGEIVFA